MNSAFSTCIVQPLLISLPDRGAKQKVIKAMKKIRSRDLFETAKMTLQQLQEHLGVAVYEVEPELVLTARHNTELLMKRYETEGISRDWDSEDKESMFYGLLGELIFQATLYQLHIPHLYTHPLYPHELRRPHDFEVDHRSIQIKTIRPIEGYKNLVVKLEEWSKSDIVVPLKLVDSKLTRADIIGYLSGNEVENLPIADQEYPCPRKPCYWCSLSEITKRHPPYELFRMLKGEGVKKVKQ